MNVVENVVKLGIQPLNYRLASSAHIGRVRLAVSNLDRSIAFYTGVIGLSVLNSRERFAQLGVAVDKSVLLELEQLPGVQPIGRRTRLGLYHTAFVLPSRKALGSFVHHLQDLQVPYGAGDHIVSEAVYLTDPDGLSVEVYADRERDQWIIRDSEVITGTQPIQVEQLLALAQTEWKGAPQGTTMGHVHLYVDDLEKASRFYHAALGMNLMTWNFPGALFVAAGEYHHHIGLNIWAAGSSPASEQDARLLFWELVLPGQQAVEGLVASLIAAGFPQTTTATNTPSFRDPWGTTVVLVVQD